MELYEIVRQHTNFTLYYYIPKFEEILYSVTGASCPNSNSTRTPINKNIKRSSLTKTPYYKWL